jgi:hypothetical protein
MLSSSSSLPKSPSKLCIVEFALRKAPEGKDGKSSDKVVGNIRGRDVKVSKSQKKSTGKIFRSCTNREGAPASRGKTSPKYVYIKASRKTCEEWRPFVNSPDYWPFVKVIRCEQERQHARFQDQRRRVSSQHRKTSR